MRAAQIPCAAADCFGVAPPGLHILLAEDDTPSVCILNRLLTACGYRVSLARNGREALDLLESECGETVDLVLSDILMPEVSGIELVGQVLQRDKLKGVPVVVMSSESSEEFIARALEAGAADYLIKPVQRSAVTMLWQHVWRSTGCSCSPAAQQEVDAGKRRGAHNPSSASSSEDFQNLVAQPSAAHSPAESGVYTAFQGKTSTVAFAAPEAVASGPGKGPIGGAVHEDARPTLPTAATGPAGAHESAASPHTARTAAIRGPSPALAADEANVSREEFDAHEDDFHTLRPGEMAATKMVDLWMARLQERDLVQSMMGGWGTKAMVQRSLHVRYFGPTFCSGLVGSDPPYERWTDRRLKHAQVADIHTFVRLLFVVHVPMHYIVVVVGPGERGIVCYDSYAGGGSPYGGKHYQD
ncbi:hypothetical protein WJX81_001346 [Elliptochloris bilobata]|uniref:Response regulatory domain-containing protein n=1 Tax=Elliptochloris bilobata TaxID=381761 RepID=A0AAW1QCT9_9CHLO